MSETDMVNPGLHLHMSNRLEILAEELAAIAASRPLPPLLAETVVVQSRGMARWLSMQLASKIGVCANLSCPFPNAFISRVLGRLLDEEATGNDEREMVTWRLMGLLADLKDETVFAPLNDYLATGGERQRFELARQLANLFDQYAVYRPDLVLAWEDGQEGGWQAELWRRLATGTARPHRAALLHRGLTALAAGAAIPDLPPRLSVFGISSLPPYHLQLLAALAERIEVNFFLLNPCREYWSDILSAKETARLGRRHGEAVLLFQEEGHALLASMGHLGRDLFAMLQELDCRETERFVPAEGESLLATIQNDILELRGAETRRRLDPQDRSILIHSCHSPLRELEVLKDQLLALFDEDPSLRPRDILVMTPDIETYGPLIQAVFDEFSEMRARIPYAIADRSIRREARLAEAFLDLLIVVDGRFGAPSILALLEEEAVRRRFGLQAADLELIETWVESASIRWGIDEECRRRLGLPVFSEHSWRAGLDRLLLGYACAGHGERLFGSILPVDGLEGSETEVLGRFVDFAETLFAALRPLAAPASLTEWSARLLTLLDTFFLADEEQERDLLHLRQTVLGLAAQQEKAGFAGQVGIETVRAHLTTVLTEEASPFGFLAGGVTFCAMLPMRAIPFKVVWLLGMNDGSFPRPTPAAAFDLMAREPRRGDRSRRLDDRYLFLEALLSARERFFISYVGKSARDNSDLPPSVLVSELLDELERGFTVDNGSLREKLVIPHRLQPFHPAYFKGRENLFSYETENREAAAALIGPRRPEGPLLPAPLAALPPDSDRVELEELCRFFAHPVRFFCEQRLGLKLEEVREELSEREPLLIEGLDRYRLTAQLLDSHLAGRAIEDQLPLARAAGLLPPGALGAVDHEGVCRQVRQLGRKVAPHVAGDPLDPLDLEFDLGGTRLAGLIIGLRPHALVRYRCAAVKPRDQIKIWLAHLLLNTAAPAGAPRESILIGQDQIYRFAPVANGRELLTELLDLFEQGLSEPLPLPPASGLAFAEAVQAGKTEEEALRAARRCWQGNGFGRQPAEGEDGYHRLCFRDAVPLAGRFAKLAAAFFLPLIAHRFKEGS
jgi:exodeoxyribonuclease V gamma subunit